MFLVNIFTLGTCYLMSGRLLSMCVLCFQGYLLRTRTDHSPRNDSKCAGVRSKSADLSGRRRMSDSLRHCTINVTTVYSRIPVNQNSLQTAERYPGPGVWRRVSVVSRQTDRHVRAVYKKPLKSVTLVIKN